MNPSLPSPEAPSSSRETLDPMPLRWPAALVVLTLAFAWPLLHWFRLTLHEEVYSYLLSIPFLALYLSWTAQQKSGISLTHSGGAEAKGWAALGSVLALLGLWLGLSRPDATEGCSVGLILAVAGWVCWVHAGSAWALGEGAMKSIRFSLAFLFFAIPLPRPWLEGFETFLQHGSAAIAPIGFQLTGIPHRADGLIFELPGINIQVARECSGVKSTIALFLTSWIASFLFLSRTWSRMVLILLAVPLGIIRNAIRITVIAWLCVKVDPSMIDSLIHRKGGPVFFALSLVFLAGIIWALRRVESRSRPRSEG